MNWEHTRLGLWAESLGVVSNYGIFVGSQVFAIAFGAFFAGIDFQGILDGNCFFADT
jgi:hypothetical protein